MRIIELKIENIKKAIKVEIRPDERVVQITGKNSQGKTSVLDSIWWAMAGTRAIQTQPIRDGADKALIRLDLGDVIVTRTFNRHDDKNPPFTTDIKVERADGSRFTKAQDVLNSYVSALTFDPLVFLRARPQEQFDMVKGFVSGVDFEVMASEDASDREARRIAAAKADELEAQAKAITLPPGKLPAPVDVAALEAKIGEAAEHNSTIAARKARREHARENILATRAAIEQQEADLAADRLRLKGLEDQFANAGELPEPTDVSQVQAALAAARQSNAVLDAARRRTDLEDQAKAKREAVDKLATSILARERRKREAIAASSMPVSGLGFEGTALTLNGRPFDQASDAEQLKASIAIAGAMNPELRVIRIRDGSLLDDDAMKWLADYCEQYDCQCWIERVDGSGEVGFVMEAGRLKGDAPPIEDDGEAI